MTSRSNRRIECDWRSKRPRGKTVFDVDPQWYESFFGHEWLELAGQPDEQKNRADVDFLVDKLELDRGARVLDMACGQGRHALELAARGFRVTGLDISEPSLAVARDRAVARGVDVELVHLDMRSLAAEQEFDAVFNFHSSFGFFATEEEDLRVVERGARALRPGGRLLIDTISDLWLARHGQPRGWRTLEDETIVIEDREFDPGSRRSSAIWTLIRPDGSRSELRHSMRVYSCPELLRLLTQAGLEPDGVWGDADGSYYSIDSRRLIVLGRKP